MTQLDPWFLILKTQRTLSIKLQVELTPFWIKFFEFLRQENKEIKSVSFTVIAIINNCLLLLLCLNRPFPSFLVPLFQNKSKCKTFHMKMSSACSFIFMQIKIIFIRMVLHLESLLNRGTRELGNGLLIPQKLIYWSYNRFCNCPISFFCLILDRKNYFSLSLIALIVPYRNVHLHGKT